MQTVKTFEELERGNTRQTKSTKSYSENAFKSKIRNSLDLIKDCLANSLNPVCLCSFGKDSLVLLHLIKHLKKIPVIYWREPYFQSKFSHVQEIAEKWELTLYDYPPTIVDYLQLEDYFDIYNFYYINGIDYINLYTGTVDYKGYSNYLCAFDLLNRPKVPAYEFKWDCIFHGQKQNDPLYITDKEIKIPELTVFGNGIMAYPLKDWTDEDIWMYINKLKLLYNKKRYDEKKDKNNNDVFPTCHNCLDYRKKQTYCPKMKKQVNCAGKTKEQNLQFRDGLLESLNK